MFRIRFAISLILALCFVPLKLAAQGYDAGQYVILSAQYGHERRHADVTDRLRELARADRPIRVSNDTFGVDPDPGVRKTLRIYAQSPNGQEQMFEFVEGSVVDGAQFRGWRGGNWGHGGWSGNWQGAGYNTGQYMILSAQYGDERRHVDVTDRLRELAKRNQQIRVGNDTFGVDPHPRAAKKLRIYARGPNGQEQMFEFREGNVVDSSQFRGWGGGNWGHGGWSGNWRSGERNHDDR